MPIALLSAPWHPIVNGSSCDRRRTYAQISHTSFAYASISRVWSLHKQSLVFYRFSMETVNHA